LGLPEEEASNQWTVFTLTVLNLNKNNKNKALSIRILELGGRQNMTGMEIKRARGKCIANVLVCQLC